MGLTRYVQCPDQQQNLMFCFIMNWRKQKLKHENVCTFFRERAGHCTGLCTIIWLTQMCHNYTCRSGIPSCHLGSISLAACPCHASTSVRSLPPNCTEQLAAQHCSFLGLPRMVKALPLSSTKQSQHAFKVLIKTEHNESHLPVNMKIPVLEIKEKLLKIKTYILEQGTKSNKTLQFLV